MADSYVVQFRGQASPAGVHALEIGTTLFTGEDYLVSKFGGATSIEADLLRIGAAIFAVDRATPRGERENVTRNLKLTVPVVNIRRLIPLVADIQQVLRLLSCDTWELDLQHLPGLVEPQQHPTKSVGHTLLFSGGLDSLAAAIEFSSGPATLQLVSHQTRNSVTNSAQRKLVALLKKKKRKVHHHCLFVSSQDGGPTGLIHAQENTQRTRSFVFLILGAILARRTNHRDLLYLAENGQMAIHLPLSQARIGAFSTHTAHPNVLAAMQDFLSAALSSPIAIRNPYLYRTKKEVVEIVAKAIPTAIPLSTSCWRNARLTKGATHCGDCVPCLVRRIAIGDIRKDATKYARDILKADIGLLAADDDGRRNLVELIEFARRLDSLSSDDLLVEYPELYSRHFRAVDAIKMYKRFAKEAQRVLSKYAGLRPLWA